MKQRYVALLRAINVGGKNVIKMNALRTALSQAGVQGVSTYIQSGNILFESEVKAIDSTVGKISKTLKKSFQYEDRILIRSQKELKATVAHFPPIFKNPKWKHNIIFLTRAIDSKEVLKNFEINYEIEQLSYFKGALYWSAKLDTLTRSKMVKLSASEEYKEMSVRNINTTTKLLDLILK